MTGFLCTLANAILARCDAWSAQLQQGGLDFSQCMHRDHPIGAAEACIIHTENGVGLIGKNAVKKCELVAGNLSKAGWSLRCVSVIDT